MSDITTATQAVAPVEGTTTQTTIQQEPQAAANQKDQFADKLELLTRKQQAIWHQSQKVKQEQQALAQERAEFERFKALKAQAKQKPLDYLAEGGLSYDEITQHVLNGGKPTQEDELQTLRNEFKQLREEQEKKEKKQQEQQTIAQRQQEEQRIVEFKDEISDFIEQNKATYELSSMRDATEDIFTTVQDAFVISLQEWHKNGRVGRPPEPMSIQAAADIVEEFYEKEVLRLTGSQKLKSKLNIQPQESSGDPAKSPSKTLTNNMASTAASVVPAKNDHDRMQRALAKLV